MELRLIPLLILLIPISKELIYCRSVTPQLNSMDLEEEANSSTTSSHHNNSVIANLTSYRRISDVSQSDDPYLSDDHRYYRSLFGNWIPPYQSLNVINLEYPSSSSCAAILTTSYYLFQVPDNGIHTDISAGRFVLATAKIEKECFLTVQDCSGSYSSTNTSLPSSTLCTTANSICCECGGCGRNSYQENENACAVLYEHAECSLCRGFRLEVQSGDEVSTMNKLVDDKVSSVNVAPGCELVIYQDDCFLGRASLATGSFNLPSEWNDVVSSYKCTCLTKDDSNMTTTTELPSTNEATTPMEVSTMVPTTLKMEITTMLPTTPTVLTTSIAPTTQITEVTTVITDTPTMAATTTTTELPVVPTTTEMFVELTTTTEAESTTMMVAPTLPATTITTVQPTETTTLQVLTTTEEITTTKLPTTIKDTTTVKYVTTEEYEMSTDHYNEVY